MASIKGKDYSNLTVSFSFGEAGEATYSLKEIPQDIQTKLALYGLAVKLQRATAGIKEDDKQKDAVSKAYESLKAGQWAAPATRTKQTKRDMVLESIREAKDPAVRDQLIRAFRAAGVFKRLNITEEDLKSL